MICFNHSNPRDINVHFLGETRMSTKMRSYVRDLLQFIAFIIFRMVSEQEERIGPFSVTALQIYSRNIVELFRNNEPVLALIDDGSGKWIVRLDGTIEDIVKYVMVYTIHLLTKKDG